MSLRSLRCLIVVALATAPGCGLLEHEPQLPPTPWRPPVREERKPFAASCSDHPQLGWCRTATTPLGVRDGRAELLRSAALDVLAHYCAECHSSVAPRGAVAPLAIDDTAELVRSGLVIPLNSAQSPLLQVASSGAMPPTPRVALRPYQLEQLALWIDTPSFWPGAAPECAAPAGAPDLDPLMEAMAADLELQPASDRPYQRYLSLAHRASAECLAGELELERQALSKGLNMLSRSSDVFEPVALDAARTLYRIDLRGLGWQRELTFGGRTFVNAWEAIAATSPYSIELTGAAASAARSASGTVFPLLFADHALDAALAGELYYAILGITDFLDLYDLIENDLLIDEAENLQDEELVRALTERSRFSQEPLLVQRQDMGTRSGVLWHAVELRSRGSSSIYDDPLGSVSGATQVMFTLPNGFFAFLSSDENGRFTVSSDMVIDTLGAPLPASAAVTCSACHASLLPVVDELRAVAVHNARERGLRAGEINALEAIYPLPSVLENILNGDSAGFQGRALFQLELTSSGRDPVAAASLRFGAPLTLRDAAAELGTSEAVLRSRLPELPWLAALAEGTLRRDDFAPVYVKSRCVLGGGSTQPDPLACARALAAPL